MVKWNECCSGKQDGCVEKKGDFGEIEIGCETISYD